MIDEAFNVVPGKKAEAYKNLTNEDWFFKCHFPGDPNMPGMLQLEAMSQTAALAILSIEGNEGKVVYIVKANNIKFKKKILVGDKLHIKTVLNSWKRGIGQSHCEAYVNSTLACSAEFSLIIDSELEKFKVR